MQLESFVAESIKGVIQGVQTAQKHFAGTETNKPVIGSPHERKFNTASTPDTSFKFDIAVTVQANAAVEGSGKVPFAIRVLTLDLSGKLSAEVDKSTVTRLSFEVPIIWPGHPSTS